MSKTLFYYTEINVSPLETHFLLEIKISCKKINALTAADSVIIPIQAQYLSAKGMTQLLQTTAHAKSVFEYDPHGNVTEAYRKLSEEVKANGERLGSLSAVSTKRSLLDTGAERQ